MMMKRTFTKEEKLQIIKEASEQGVRSTLERHGVYSASYYSWRRKYEQMGEVFEVTAEAVDRNARTVRTDITWEISERHADNLELLQTEGEKIEVRALAPGYTIAINAYAEDVDGITIVQIK